MELSADKFTIRLVKLEDAAKLLEIYAPYVISDDLSKSCVSFEYDLPSEKEFKDRIESISKKYPYLVAELDGEPVGYAYAHAYIDRAAYQWGAEVTIYISEAGQHCGLGRRLYTILEELLRLQGITTTYSCIAARNEHSVKMHEALGYRLIGDFRNSGYKKGTWLDMVWLGKEIQSKPEKPSFIVPFPKLDKQLVEKILRVY